MKKQIENISNWIRSNDPVEQIQQCKKVLPKIYNPVIARYKIHATDENRVFHFLIDMKTNRVILATHNIEVIRVLSRMPNMFANYNLTCGDIAGVKKWKLHEGFDFEYPWNAEALDVMFFINESIISVKPLTNEQIYYYFLVQQKAILINVILETLETMRLDSNPCNLLYQQSIYIEKYQQAKLVLEHNVIADHENKYFYVADWAAIKQIDMQSAARDIQLNHELMNHRISKTEYARLLYINKIRDENDLMQLPEIMKDFRMFNFGYLKL